MTGYGTETTPWVARNWAGVTSKLDFECAFGGRSCGTFFLDIMTVFFWSGYFIIRYPVCAHHMAQAMMNFETRDSIVLGIDRL